MKTGLTISEFQRVNIERLPHFKNSRGERAHSTSDGSDWSLGEWACATLGELGEAANLIKKIQRGDVPLSIARADLADELADTLTYLVILAERAGVDLEQATISKWNRVSAKVDYSVRIADRAKDATAAG